MSNKAYWVNYSGYTTPKSQFKRRPLTPAIQHPNAPKLKRWDELHLHRLQRDGWDLLSPSNRNEYHFSKNMNDTRHLIKTIYLGQHKHLSGKASTYETHRLVNRADQQSIDFPDWEWADIDYGRIVFAEKGKLCVLPFTENELDINAVKILYDFTPMVIEEAKAPYGKNYA